MSSPRTIPAAQRSDVLVVGAGPVGLFTALLLSRRGLSVTVVERYRSPLQAPKAHVLNPRTLEIFRQCGIDVGKMRQRATRVQDTGWVRFTLSLAGREYGKVPYERQDEAMLELTPTPLMSMPQPSLEHFLAEQVAAEPKIQVRRGHLWQSFEQREQESRSTIKTDEGTYELESRYVLACDGAGSTVREALDIGMEGVAEVQHSQNIHFHANLRHLVDGRPGIIYWVVNQDVAGSFIAHDIDRNWVFLRFDRPDEIPNRELTAEEARRILRAAIGADVPVSVQRASPWTMVAEVATRFRQGNAFLMGDAAHRFPPAGGLGLNTGIQDAHNIVWKLAAIAEGWADRSILDTYEQERRGVAWANTRQSLSNALTIPRLVKALVEAAQYDGKPLPPALAKEMDEAIALHRVTFDNLGLHLGFTYDREKPLPPGPHIFVPRAEPGDRLPHCWIGDPREGVSNLDFIRYDRFTLFVNEADHAVGDWAKRALAPVEVVPAGTAQGFPTEWLELAGLNNEAAAMLVRPDGHIAARVQGLGRPELEQLAAAFRSTLGRA